MTCLLVALAVTGCDFSEECSYTGNAEILADWDTLWEYIDETNALTAVFYKGDGTSVSYPVERGVACQRVSSGGTRLLVYNAAEGVEVKETADGYPELQQATFYNGDVLAVGECPMVCAGTAELTVPVDGTVYQLVNLAPVVKRLNFKVNVSNAQSLGGVASVIASFGGVATGYSMNERIPTGASATVFFPLEQSGVQSEVFSHELNVFGVSADGTGQLAVEVKYKNGSSKVYNLNLKATLNKFTKDVFLCEVELRASETATNASVTKWTQESW